ncbi:isopenicillin N-epimerase [Salpingoeca rosetta]|uniref:Isopenicillin N-epimerase n=1 Tax=Salpingoeca rosetta (strain ATCC 50818 / BSB-021) TaxID=946362 RepID=F2UE07_SALR5|nr:isopenicillin N-epimerase [Salpingoeca rosetta]EGD74857.1 isopenicillin N-epimerase [Salpingoeca rosetta]|eukprot:XP_004992502.1 isopenicillin N-epimerase [Salpingoeca rosetta]
MKWLVGVARTGSDSAREEEETSRRRLRSGFGSFATPSVEDLVRVPPSEWPAELTKGAPVPPDVCMCVPGSDGMRDQFMIDFERWAFLNHGAFGASLRCVLKHAQAWREKQEEQPLRFFDRQLLPELVRTIHRMASFMQAQPTDMVFVPNATSALNTVLQSMARRFTPRDSILTLDIAYGSVKKMVDHVAQRTGATHVSLRVPLPLSSPADILDLVRNHLSQCAADQLPTLAVFDHITSNTALQLPLTELAELVAQHSPGTRVLVDGAHGLVQAHVDMSELQAAGVHYYAANCHKWMCSAKSVGVLWAGRDEDKAAIEPMIISHGHGQGFTSDFVWDGCRDYAPTLSLCTALDFWDVQGVGRMRAYSRGLLADAAAFLRDAWGTGGIVASKDPASHLALHGCMALVALPAHKDVSHAALAATRRHVLDGSTGTGDGGDEGHEGGRGDGAVDGGRDQSTDKPSQQQQQQQQQEGAGPRVQNWLYSNGIEVPVKTINGELYVRISAHIYNRIEDYRPLADIINALPDRK